MTYTRTPHVRAWHRGRFWLTVHRRRGGWDATVAHTTPSGRHVVDSVDALCRSRSRAVDVGQRMLARALRDRGLGSAALS